VTVKINRFRDRLTTPHSPALATSTTRARRCGDTELTTAKTLGLKIPEAFLLRADEVIE